MESSKENSKGEDSYLDGPNDCNINKTLSDELSTSGNEFHITDEELIECCNKAEVTMKEERSPLFILREKSKRNYSREFREKAKLAFLYDPAPEKKASDRGYDDIEKEDAYNVNQTLVPTNQFKTEISNNYEWEEDDDDIFASISTQEILHQDVKINNNFPHTSKFPVNKQITQGNQRDNISGYSKNLVLREINVALGLQKTSGEQPELGVGKNAVGLNEIFTENEWEEVKS
ncbi:uncharacterized protein ACN2A1_009305 [Glossina fuscipes fuscipes]